MAKLLPFAASGVAPQGVQGSSHGGQSLTPLCRSSGIGSALNLDRWNAHFMGKASCGRRRHVFVTCAGKGGSKKVDGTGKQAVLDKGKKDNVPSVKKESEPVIPDLWSAGASVTALQPREEENLLLASWYARNPGGWKNSKRPDPETVSGSGGVRVSDERARVDVLLRDQDAQDARVDGEEDGKEESEVGEDEKEEWVEIEDEEWDKRLAEGDEDLELVEVWEGDLGPMTAEEEAALLLEAEQEIAELEREQAEKERRASSAAASPSKQSPGQGASGKQNVTEMEKELAMLQELVGNLQEQIAKEKSEGSEGSSSGTGPSAPLHDNGEEDQNSLEVPTKTSASKFFEMYKWDKDQGIVRRKGKERDISPDAPTNETVSRFDLEGSEDDGSSEDISEHMTTEATSSRPEKRRIIAEPHEYEGDEDVDDLDKDKRGIPAVMRCFDRAKIYAKAGDGGDGVVAFRREKFVPFGGPSGGNGGDGGDVYIEADPGINSLLPFRRTIHFRATRGSHGQGKAKTGATGEHCIVKVPVGTLVKDSEGNGDILLDLSRPGQRELLLPGGRGGRGNGAFKSGRNKAPQIAENGEEGAEMWVELELKLVADVGIIGVPNAGKSTLLSSISAARPEIANYPFTTLLPNLGVVALGFDASMVVADLPGLLEGAHTGYGLGHEFLRHTERCRVLIHVVDGMSQQAEYEYEAVRLELQLFNPELQHKPFLVAYNKMDIPEAADRWENFQRFLRSKGVEPLCMSAATQQGTKEVVDAAYELLKQSAQPLEADADVEVKGPSVGEIVKQKRSAPIEDFSITCDKHTRTWYIDGAGLKRFTQMTNWEYFEAVRRFQHVLNASGVSKALREQGVQEGDTVIVGQMEFNWVDKDDFRSLGEWKRGIRGSKVWPH